MAFTSTDLANVEAAIVSLATGSRGVSLSVGGKQITFAQHRLDDLYRLRDLIQPDIAIAAGTAVLRTYAKNGGRTG